METNESQENVLLTREASLRADENAIKKFCIPSLVLMENAGRSCAENLMLYDREHEKTNSAVLVLCGPGNNGGDGFVIARHLYNAGIKVKVMLFRPSEEYAGDARLNLIALSGLQLTIVEFHSSWTEEELRDVFSEVSGIPTTWVVDALLGTGASGAPRGSMARAINAANRMDACRFAVDIPSGLDCDTGVAAETTFRADLTCTMIAQKAGFKNPESKEYTGRVVVVGIGAPQEIVD